MNAQLDLRFHGSDYDHERDGKRLTGQLLKIHNYMIDGKPRTLQQIADAIGEPPASISAQLRNFRQKGFRQFGIDFDKRYISQGLYEYWLFRRVYDQD